MIIRLKRFSYAPTETEGLLFLPDHVPLATMEQPWKPNPNGTRGGWPFKSCVPDGMYNLHPWTMSDGAEVYIMTNPELGVHRLPEHHPEGEGRDLCLIHVGNFAADVKGCVVLGVRRVLMADKYNVMQRAVASSGIAISALRVALGRTGSHILSIENATGAKD